MRAAALIAFWKSRRWARITSARRPGPVRCGNAISLVRGRKGAKKSFGRKSTHSSRQLKTSFPGPKTEQREGHFLSHSCHAWLRSPGGECALLCGWRFGSLKDGRALGVVRRPGSECSASRCKPDTVVMASFDRFYFVVGRKGAEENIWRGGGQETHVWTTPTDHAFSEAEVEFTTHTRLTVGSSVIRSKAVPHALIMPMRSL